MKLHATAMAAGFALAAGNAFAGPDDYIHTPTVEYGEKEIDFRFGTSKSGDSASESAATIGFGYGATSWWFTEFYFKYKREERDNGMSTKFDAVEWENKFQLTETGKYPLEVGLLVEVERPTDHAEGWEFKYGPLFQTDFGKVQVNANLLFESVTGSDEDPPTQLKTQLQVKYRWMEKFEFGVQGFGELGKWNDWASWNDESHRFGPAIFGKFPLGGGQAIKYNAAWLFGLTQASPDNTFRMQVEYEF